jgi:Asp-tRNA(Asn)/Glu-tRNA(Gln) amidotransferase A subunit family amidase
MTPAEYADCDAIELARRMEAGVLTPREALELSYAIVEAVDPAIHAFVSLEREAALDAAAGARGALAGVPIAMKDCLGCVAGAPRSYGSALGAGSVCDHDDTVVRRFRKAGLVPMGTTNVPEFSSALTTESRFHGPCLNPWDPSRTTGGSSGGSAAAVAYGAVPVGYGNDSAGSIRIPSSTCGVFGFRPGRGRVPNGPHGEVWYGLFTHHVITRSVRDSALILDLIEGPEPGMPYAAPAKSRDFLEECTAPAPSLRVALWDGAGQGVRLDPACAAGLIATGELLSSLGHVVRPAEPPCRLAELAGHLTTYISVSLAEELPLLADAAGRRIGPETVEACHLALLERGRRTSAVELSQALAYRGELGQRMGEFYGRWDVLLTPTLAGLPPPLGFLSADAADLEGYLTRKRAFSPFAAIANVCGVPSMSVPLWWSGDGLPVGMMFTGPYGSESLLFRLAGQLERARPWRERHPPQSAWQPVP